MALTQNQFAIVNALFEEPGLSQRQLANRTGLGLATVNAAMKECREAGLVEEGRLTAHGIVSSNP